MIEWCEWCVEFESSDYQDFGELIEQWNDWWDEDDVPYYDPPVFTQKEQDSLKAVNRAYDSLWVEVQHRPMITSQDLSFIYPLEQWKDLKVICHAALDEFNLRGKLSEDVEIKD